MNQFILNNYIPWSSIDCPTFFIHISSVQQKKPSMNMFDSSPSKMDGKAMRLHTNLVVLL